VWNNEGVALAADILKHRWYFVLGKPDRCEITRCFLA
jgi:hypothetical protein